LHSPHQGQTIFDRTAASPWAFSRANSCLISADKLLSLAALFGFDPMLNLVGSLDRDRPVAVGTRDQFTMIALLNVLGNADEAGSSAPSTGLAEHPKSSAGGVSKSSDPDVPTALARGAPLGVINTAILIQNVALHSALR
jgi:hypothetical protein